MGISLFQRLQRQGLTPELLDTQYRMHPQLADFPNNAFYFGRLKSAPTPDEREAPAGVATFLQRKPTYPASLPPCRMKPQ